MTGPSGRRITDEGTITVVLVDDDPAYGTTAGELLERENDRIEALTVTSVETARAIVDERAVDCVVSDYRLPAMDGLALRDSLREDYPRLPFVLLTGKASGAVAADAIEADRSDYVEKGTSNQYAVLAHRISSLVSRNRAEREAAAKENRIESILDQLSDGFYALDNEWRFTYANDRVLERLDTTLDDLLGANVWEKFPETVETPFYDAFTEAMETKESVTCEAPLDIRDAVIQARVFPSDSGLAVYTRDVTEEHERESARLLFERIVDDAGIGLASYDSSGRFQFANEQFGSLVRSPVAELDTLRVWDVFTDLSPAQFDAYWSTFEEGEQRGAQVDVERLDDTTIPSRRITSQTVVDGTKYNLVSLWECTRSVEREQQLAVLNRILRHNLRNKLNVVRGQAERLLDESNIDVDEVAPIIKQSTADILSVAESARTIEELNTSDFERMSVDVTALVETVVEQVVPGTGVEPVLDVPEEEYVLASERFALALEHIVVNACEHNDSPDPFVAVRVRPAPERDGWTDISVADNGPGMPRVEQQILTGAEETKLRHGSGVGLWIVRWLVSRYGGEISVSERDGGGTVVTVSLPSSSKRTPRGRTDTNSSVG